MGFHRNNVLITHLINTMQILCVCFTHNNNNSLHATVYQVLVLFCRQDFGNSGQKVSGTLEMIGKSF